MDIQDASGAPGATDTPASSDTSEAVDLARTEASPESETSLEPEDVPAHPSAGGSSQGNTPVVVSTQAKETVAANKASTKYATPIDPGEYIILRADTNTVTIDVSGGQKKNGTNIQLYEYNKTPAQYWRATIDAEGRYTFTNTNSGKALDVAGGKARNGNNVWQYAKNSTLAQKWILVETDTGLRIESAINRNYVLDCSGGNKKNGTNIQVYKNNGTAAQRFSFINRNPQVESQQTVANGVYVIDSLVDTSKALDVSGGSAASGANVQVYAENETTAQRWSLNYGADGYYTITSVESGMVLDVSGAKQVPTTNVQQWKSNNTDAQKWAIQENADGSYSFISKVSGMALQLQGGKASNGTNVYTMRPSTAKSQKFNLNRVPVLADGVYTFYSKLAQTSQVLDIAGGSAANNVAVQTYSYTNCPAQRYVLTNLGNDTYSIQAVASGRYVTDASGQVVQQTKGEGAEVSNAQKWKVQFRGGGVVFTNVSTGKAMAVSGTKAQNGTKVQTQAYSGKAAEKFRPVKQSTLLAQGLYTFSVPTQANMVIDVADGSWKNKANVQMYKSNNSNAQKFALIPASAGYYHIVMPLSGNAVEVASSGAGANVRTNTAISNSASQLWKPELTDAGIVFTNKETGTVLSVGTTKAANGTNVQVANNTGEAGQAWNLHKTNVNLTDSTSLRNLIKSAPSGRSPKLDANGRSYKVSSGAYKQLMKALGQAWNRGKYVNFIMVETDTGISYALNADSTTYGASTMKSALVTYIYQQLLEKGKVRNSDVYDLMYNTIVHSNNEAYATLYNRYAGSAYRNWLNGAGVGFLAGTLYPYNTPRNLELTWVKMAGYESSGGKYVGQWRKMFNKSDMSFIRLQLSGSNTVYSKPGWMFASSVGNIYNDAGLVRDSSGRTYMLSVMSNLSPASDQWIAKGVVGALDRIHKEMPAA